MTSGGNLIVYLLDISQQITYTIMTSEMLRTKPTLRSRNQNMTRIRMNFILKSLVCGPVCFWERCILSPSPPVYPIPDFIWSAPTYAIRRLLASRIVTHRIQKRPPPPSTDYSSLRGFIVIFMCVCISICIWSSSNNTALTADGVTWVELVLHRHVQLHRRVAFGIVDLAQAIQ